MLWVTSGITGRVIPRTKPKLSVLELTRSWGLSGSKPGAGLIGGVGVRRSHKRGLEMRLTATCHRNCFHCFLEFIPYIRLCLWATEGDVIQKYHPLWLQRAESKSCLHQLLLAWPWTKYLHCLNCLLICRRPVGRLSELRCVKLFIECLGHSKPPTSGDLCYYNIMW